MFSQLNCAYLCKTEFFEIELFMKMDLALNNLQRLICHKSQQTNQPTNQPNKNNLQEKVLHATTAEQV